MKKFLIYFIFVMAVFLAAIVAYVSISGLLTVFSGAGILGLLLFSTIEISKIIATSAIHTYGKKIGLFYNVLLSLGILIAMCITSMGVYGFLSSGYQKNVAKSTGSDREILLIDNKIKLKEKSRESINLQLVQTQKSITQLRSALGNNTQSRVDKNGNVITTSSAENRKAFEGQLKIATESEIRLSKDLNFSDSIINHLSEQKLELETDASMSNELGPLKYLAEVTGSSMDNVMKWFIFLLIIIGDPMAILMIIIFNKIINEESDDEKTNKTETEDDLINDEYEYIYDGIYDIVSDDDIEQYISNNDKVIEELNVELEPQEEIIEKPKERKITIDDLPERNNRGFSVNIPNRKSNVVERIGSNKEVRKDNPDKIVFKKRN
jgi:hypothetical protein